MIQSVSANLARRAVGGEWAREVVRRRGERSVDLVFLQEVPPTIDWTALCEETDFGMAEGAGPSYQVRSLLLWRRSVIAGEPLTLATAGYHGSYLAAATLDLPSVGRVAAVSVHASPSVVTSEYEQQWRACERKLPNPRASAGSGERWDSDFVLATLAELAAAGPVLAAGDFNECLAWDDDHPGTWGREYFDRVAQARLISLAHRPGAGERRTAFTHRHLSYQLDHVFATNELAELIPMAPIPDLEWTFDTAEAGTTSDHAPLWFTIGR